MQVHGHSKSFKLLLLTGDKSDTKSRDFQILWSHMMLNYIYMFRAASSPNRLKNPLQRVVGVKENQATCRAM